MPDSSVPMSGLLHEPTQVHPDRIDLTVREVYTIDSPGRVDFGGSELQPASRSSHDRYWRSEDDEYQWWALDAGQYLIEYNETLDTSDGVMLQPRPALVERGAFHPTMIVEQLHPVPLTVGGAGIELKENARVSAVVPRQR